MRPGRFLAGLWLAALVAGCASPIPSPSSSGSGDVPLRTFAWSAEQGGQPIVCTAFAAAHPVSGILRGDASDPRETIWLEGRAGTRLSIVWPAGFTVSFVPEPVLRDEGGVIVAKAGDRVELGQVDAFESAGTFGDPYLASGLVFHGCYALLP